MTALAPLIQTSRAAGVQQIHTPGGVTAWLVEDYAVPLVAFQVAFRGGAAQDPLDKTGMATMLASLLDEGAGAYDSTGFHEALDELAAHLHFSADRDHIAGHFQTLTKNLDPAVELMRLAVCEAQLTPSAIDRVSSQLLAGLRRELKDPDAMASRMFRASAFPHHPYGRAVRGEIETLPLIGRDDLVAMRHRLFARENLVVAAVGAIDAASLAEKLDRIFGALPAQAQLTPVANVEMAGLGDKHIATLDVPQSTLRFGRPGLSRTDPDFSAAIVVSHIFGGGAFSARLFREVREKRGLAYSAYAHLQNYEHAALLVGATSTKNESAGEALGVIEEQIQDLAAHGPTPEELEKAKKYLIGSYALRFDTSTKIAGNLVHLQLEGYSADYLDDRNRRIATVTLEDAKRTANRLFGDGSMLVAVAGRPAGL